MHPDGFRIRYWLKVQFLVHDCVVRPSCLHDLIKTKTHTSKLQNNMDNIEWFSQAMRRRGYDVSPHSVHDAENDAYDHPDRHPGHQQVINMNTRARFSRSEDERIQLRDQAQLINQEIEDLRNTKVPHRLYRKEASSTAFGSVAKFYKNRGNLVSK